MFFGGGTNWKWCKIREYSSYGHLVRTIWVHKIHENSKCSRKVGVLLYISHMECTIWDIKTNCYARCKTFSLSIPKLGEKTLQLWSICMSDTVPASSCTFYNSKCCCSKPNCCCRVWRFCLGWLQVQFYNYMHMIVAYTFPPLCPYLMAHHKSLGLVSL